MLHFCFKNSQCLILEQKRVQCELIDPLCLFCFFDFFSALKSRPIAGHANLCPESISTKPQDLETLLSTVKHEILHALGFSVSLYAYFRDKEGRPLTRRGKNGKPILGTSQSIPGHIHSSSSPTTSFYWGENVIKRLIRHDWKVRSASVKKEIHMISTPRVIEEVRSHFDCPTLEGAELEDQGEDGTILTHWEKRVFEVRMKK